MLTAAQIRAARAMLGWSVGTLSLRAGISQAVVRQIELRGEWARRRPEDALRQVRTAFEAAGVTFLEDDGKVGPGVRCCEAADQ